jgi:predicted esterase
MGRARRRTIAAFMTRVPLTVVLVMALVAGCASVPPTPSPSPTAQQPLPTTAPPSSPSASPTLALSTPATPTASPPPTSKPTLAPPSATAKPPLALEGTWESGPITREMIRDAVREHGFVPAGIGGRIEDARAFVDYIVYEVTIGADTWTEIEIPDGLPWSTGWNGTYRRPMFGTFIATDSTGRCHVTLSTSGSNKAMGIAVTDDSCGDADLLAQIAVYEPATFHRVEGPGSPEPTLQPPGTAQPQTPLVSSSHRRLTQRALGSVEGADMGYLEYLPPSYGDGTPRPLLVALHGSGQSGPGDSNGLASLYEIGIPPLIRNDRWPDNRPFIVLAPQHDIHAPEVCITAPKIANFLTFAIAHYEVDPARVYVTGLSCGAIGSWNYLATDTTTVAAAVLISGGGYAAIDRVGCGLGSVPVWALHGTLDDVVPARYDTYSIGSLQQCTDPLPVDARLTLYPDAAHDAWTRTYDLSAGNDIYSWLLSYTK